MPSWESIRGFGLRDIVLGTAKNEPLIPEPEDLGQGIFEEKLAPGEVTVEIIPVEGGYDPNELNIRKPSVEDYRSQFQKDLAAAIDRVESVRRSGDFSFKRVYECKWAKAMMDKRKQ